MTRECGSGSDRCKGRRGMDRRDFLQVLGGGALVGLTGFARASSGKAASITAARQCGPAANYTPTIKATFVRRKEDYGMWWPGAVYDGEAARKKYTRQLKETAADLGAELDLRSKPIYSMKEADAWAKEAESQSPDGLMVVTLDRQQHSWPTVRRAAKTDIPLVVFSPIGTSFTTNTGPLADETGCVIYSAEEFDEAIYGMHMLDAGARMRQTRCVVLKGNKRAERELGDLGVNLQYVPVNTYVKEFRRAESEGEAEALASKFASQAREVHELTDKNLVDAARAYIASRRIIEREEADCITMDCLGMGKQHRDICLPCLAWSRFNDQGVPAACEADMGAMASHILVQYLFERPGFQQDPVADTMHDAVIGAHCSCPTRLNGFDKQSEPFGLMHHHAKRDVTARPLWKKGQRVTSVDVYPGNSKRKTRMEIATGTVLSNLRVPPNGGCVVSVRVEFDSDTDVRAFPGFHQLWFYGDYGQKLEEFCQLYDFEAEWV